MNKSNTLSMYEISFNPLKSKEQRKLWDTEMTKFNYPRPQGNLPASQWLYNIEFVPKVYYDHNSMSSSSNSLFSKLKD